MNPFLKDPRFAGIEPFEKKVWLASPTMHGDEQRWVDEAIQTNWVSTVGANINELEKEIASYVGVRYAVALSAGTAHTVGLHPDGTVVAEAPYDRRQMSVLTVPREKTSAPEVWSVVFPQVEEDALFRIGAPALPIVATGSPEMAIAPR